MTYAVPLPPGKRQFIYTSGTDINGEPLAGRPLAGGSVTYYYPGGGSSPKDTYQDFDATIVNDNPLTLDSAGQAIIWGIGRYREIVKDSLGNLQWDQETVGFSNQPYEVGGYFVDVPSAGDIILAWPFTQTVNFPANFSGSAGSVNTNPNALINLDIKKNGSIIGEIIVTTGGVVTFTASAIQFAPTDLLTVVTQSGGAHIAAGFAMNFLGSLVL